jgi:hypothetical protein
MTFRTLAGAITVAAAGLFLSRPLDARWADQNNGGPCVICHEDCPVGEHIAVNGGMTLPAIWHRNGGSHIGGQCIQGTCDQKHGPSDCTIASLQHSDMERLDRALLAADVRALQSLVSEFPDAIVVSATRGAIQVRDCQGGLRAHIPLDPQVLSELAE